MCWSHTHSQRYLKTPDRATRSTEEIIYDSYRGPLLLFILVPFLRDHTKAHVEEGKESPA